MMTTGRINKRDRLEQLRSPYGDEQAESKARLMEKGRQPKDFEAHIRWFREVIHEEVPVAIHKDGVFFGPPGREGEPMKPEWVGGSQIGAPAIRDEFRRFIEGVPWQTDEDGYYQRPFRATLARYARKYPLTASCLFRLALVDGDWRRLADRDGYAYEVMEKYLTRALWEFWTEYADQERRLP